MGTLHHPFPLKIRGTDVEPGRLEICGAQAGELLVNPNVQVQATSAWQRVRRDDERSAGLQPRVPADPHCVCRHCSVPQSALSVLDVLPEEHHVDIQALCPLLIAPLRLCTHRNLD